MWYNVDKTPAQQGGGEGGGRRLPPHRWLSNQTGKKTKPKPREPKTPIEVKKRRPRDGEQLGKKVEK